MLESIRSALPRSLKQAVRQGILDPFQRRLSDWHLQQSVRALRASALPDRGQIEAFRRAWGNESFSADATYIGEIVNRVGRCTFPVLECGSGVTTLVAGLIGERRNTIIWSLEQDPEWAEFVKHKLKKNGIRNVEVRYAPLKDYGGYVWYDVGNIDLPPRFDLVLCDGPAIFEQWGSAYEQWRYGVLPVLAGKGIAVGEVLLDDAMEPRGARLLARWQQEFGMGHRMIRTADGDCAIIGTSASD